VTIHHQNGQPTVIIFTRVGPTVPALLEPFAGGDLCVGRAWALKDRSARKAVGI
jgi:hypothetical protein